MKAWCYYESRLLGAHHGLLSTYALETMVLYIFNMYHQELQWPLKVGREPAASAGKDKLGVGSGTVIQHASCLGKHTRDAPAPSPGASV